MVGADARDGAGRDTHAATPSAPGHERRETYTHGLGRAVEWMARRMAADQTATLLPLLRPGMRVLDFGCGPGSITLGLAGAVAPGGEAVGVDVEPTVVERAAALAAERGVPNVRFEVASVYALPFPDARFDAAFGNQVLQHLGDVPAALGEVRRVLRPGGVLLVRDTDQGSRVAGPPGPAAEQLQEAVGLYLRVWRDNGGDPFVGRRHRALLRAAGFARTEGGAAASRTATAGAAESTRGVGESFARRLLRPDIASRIVERGWADSAHLESLATGCRVWGELPDAFVAALTCETLAWTTDETKECDRNDWRSDCVLGVPAVGERSTARGQPSSGQTRPTRQSPPLQRQSTRIIRRCSMQARFTGDDRDGEPPGPRRHYRQRSRRGRGATERLEAWCWRGLAGTCSDRGGAARCWARRQTTGTIPPRGAVPPLFLRGAYARW